MIRNVTIAKRTIPLFLIILGLVASGAGAVAAQATSGKITGGINITTTGSGSGLLVGNPTSAVFIHSPNDACEDNADALTNENPTAVWLTQIIDFSHLSFKDQDYQETTSTIPDIAQQIYKFYVGPVANITKLSFNLKGKAGTGGKFQIWDNGAGAWNTTMQRNVNGTDDSYAINVTNTTDVTISEAVVSGYVYAQIFADAGEKIDTDYTWVAATYSAVDVKNWSGFSGPEVFRRIFTVPERWGGTHADDQSAFRASSELGTGDWWLVALPIKNAGTANINARMTLNPPADINLYACSAEEMNDPNARIHGMVQTGQNTWEFIVNGNAEKIDDNDYLYIAVNAHSDGRPGYYNVPGLIEQLPF